MRSQVRYRVSTYATGAPNVNLADATSAQAVSLAKTPAARCLSCDVRLVYVYDVRGQSDDASGIVRDLNQTMTYRNGHCLQARSRVELVEQIRDVVANGMHAQKQRPSDVARGLSLG